MAVASTGSWQAVFFFAAAVNGIAALLAIFVLKPMRARQITETLPASKLAAEPAQ
ncbi:hypothetical protein D3C71_2216050 [compost metagenome]